jgi:hypothetical protein
MISIPLPATIPRRKAAKRATAICASNIVIVLVRAEKRLGDCGYASTSDRREMVTAAMHNGLLGWRPYSRARARALQRVRPVVGVGKFHKGKEISPIFESQNEGSDTAIT